MWESYTERKMHEQQKNMHNDNFKMVYPSSREPLRDYWCWMDKEGIKCIEVGRFKSRSKKHLFSAWNHMIME